jgi:hypothetical protein
MAEEIGRRAGDGVGAEKGRTVDIGYLRARFKSPPCEGLSPELTEEAHVT